MSCLRDTFSEGQLLDGRYRTVSPLNHGSFGMVFLAFDTVADEQVAIKCLTKRSAHGDAGVDFAVDDKSEELALHRRLGSHPHIVNLLRKFETDAHVYLVLEYCSQGDLYEAIRLGHGPLETEHVRRFMLELIDAVAFTHVNGVFHRDIKPENIFLTQDGTMKLGDFGLATTDKWSYEMTVGSDRYMAPEQFDSAGAGYSPAEADIWAVGICLLNILFSRNPFTTPTESDPLFLDFSRDKQSLFDVFPTMSQDTYEVIVQCMNLDPKKRSLIGARDALQRVVSFTAQDEILDDFCVAEKGTIASANREPLRTPSIQSPHVDEGGAFPWAKALHATPRRIGRQLSAIPDDESYSEDLFSKSEETMDWCSVNAQTPSLSSMLDSGLRPPLMPLAVNRGTARPAKKVSPMAGSVPISMAKPPPLSMASVFGRRKEQVSKSWSDMWDEDEEEESLEQQREMLKELNSRTWSQESKPEAKKVSVEIRGDIDDDLVADGFFFQEVAPDVKQVSMPEPPRYSPPPKRTNLDKWAALGERRRGGHAVSLFGAQSVDNKSHRPFGISFKSYEAGVWDHHNHHHGNHKLAATQPPASLGKEKPKERTWNKGRGWNWRAPRRHDLGDAEWVGGW